MGQQWQLQDVFYVKNCVSLSGHGAANLSNKSARSQRHNIVLQALGEMEEQITS